MKKKIVYHKTRNMQKGDQFRAPNAARIAESFTADGETSTDITEMRHCTIQIGEALPECTVLVFLMSTDSSQQPYSSHSSHDMSHDRQHVFTGTQSIRTLGISPIPDMIGQIFYTT